MNVISETSSLLNPAKYLRKKNQRTVQEKEQTRQRLSTIYLRYTNFQILFLDTKNWVIF